MASQAPQLPLMYNQLEPLSNQAHANYKLSPIDAALHLVKVHAVPLVVDEFVSAQRYYPIVFSLGDNPVPLALMGLNEGVNTFVDDEGKLVGPAYVPAYVRRYPFMLARVTEDGDTLSLCFDPSSGFLGEFDAGDALFDGDQPSQTTQNVMKFCEDFEVAAQRTNQFMEELQKLDLLMEGELSVQLNSETQPNVYRGFRMIDEEKLKDMRGDELRRLNQNGILGLLMAHLFSLPLSRDIFLRQVDQGKGPQPVPLEAAPAAEA